MPSPTTARGLLGDFLSGADLPATNPRASPPPVRLPTSSSLRKILEAKDGVRKHGAGQTAAGARGTTGVGAVEKVRGTRTE